MKAEAVNNGKNTKKITMRLKLILFLAGFTLFSVLTVWVVQVFMSDALYENVKTREIEATAKYIRDQVISGSSETNEKIDEYSDENNICIGLYLVEKGEIKELHSSLVFLDNIIHNASPKMLSSIYDLAQKQGGKYTARFGFDFFAPNGSNESQRNDGMIISSVYASVFKGEDQNEYMLLLNSNLTPVNAAKKTFGAQFGYTMIVLVIFSVFMAYMLSRFISRPLKSMTATAKELAKGRYDINFNGGDYREISELSETLNYAASELAKNDRLQKELIANISHDLRTPLTMIKGYSEIIRDIPGENTAENIQAVIDETTRLSELVNDLLDLSRIESGTENFEIESFDLTAAVNEVICRYDKMKAVEAFKIEFRFDGNIKVYADRSMILQVIYNLISNAINYSGDDKYVGVIQSVTRDRYDRKYVRISVVDHGEGIKKEDLPLIWDRYYKVDGVHRRATAGTGIGLSIVKKVLERHEAAYGVESAVGSGSVFWFELPVSEE